MPITRQADRCEIPSPLSALTASLRCEGPAVFFDKLPNGVELEFFASDNALHLRILGLELLESKIARLEAGVLVSPASHSVGVDA